MPKRTSRKIPKGASVLRTYDGLHAELDAFAHQERHLVILVGPPGSAKSTAARRFLKEARIIEGGCTPYRLYQELYANRDLPIVLDDADRVFADRNGVFLLKIVTQTIRRKTVQWNSATAEIRSGDLPAEFSTTSRVLIIANSWPEGNADIAAVESRGHLHYFVPSQRELHRYAGTFSQDPEVYSFIGEYLHHFDALDLRLYHKAAEIKATGLRTGHTAGWREYVQAQMMPAETRIALELMRDAGYPSDNQRAGEFHRITGMSTRAYYRYRDEILLRQPEAGANACQEVKREGRLTS